MKDQQKSGGDREMGPAQAAAQKFTSALTFLGIGMIVAGLAYKGAHVAFVEDGHTAEEQFGIVAYGVMAFILLCYILYVSRTSSKAQDKTEETEEEE